MDRDQIQRRDFPTGRRGYDISAVDEHLRFIADAFEHNAPVPSVAATTSEQVREILEAAERSVTEVRARAGAEAADHVAAVQAATAGMLAQLDHLESELTHLLTALRTSGERLDEGLAQLQSDVLAGIPPIVPGLSSPIAPAPPAPTVESPARPTAESSPAPAEDTPPAAQAVAPAPPAAGSSPASAEDAPPAPRAESSARHAADAPPASAEDTPPASLADSPTPPTVDAPPAPSALADGASPAGSPAAATNGHADPERRFPRRRRRGPEEEPPPAAEPDAATRFDASPGQADEAGARLIALNMALSGETREDTARFLEEHFELADVEALLDDVFARAGR